MKIAVMTDMEGCAGILNHDVWVLPAGRFYDKALRLCTAEANAAVEGFCDGGATEVVVVDGHGAGGIDPQLLDERAPAAHVHRLSLRAGRLLRRPGGVPVPRG